VELASVDAAHAAADDLGDLEDARDCPLLEASPAPHVVSTLELFPASNQMRWIAFDGLPLEVKLSQVRE